MELEKIYQHIIDGDIEVVENGLKGSLVEGIDAGVIFNEALIAAMDKVGRRFEEGELFVPEMLVSAKAMQAGLNLLKPHFAATDVKAAGKVAIGFSSSTFTPAFKVATAISAWMKGGVSTTARSRDSLLKSSL